MTRFFKDFKKYFAYAKYSAIAELKAEVADSKLGWLWWILDPLLFMLVYSFVVSVVFGQTIEYLPIFVFVGLTFWNLFATTVQSSVNCVRSYRSVILKTYLPKFVLVLMIQIVNFIKCLISLGISLIAIIVVGIEFTPNILSLIPILLVYMILIFGISLIGAHIGVFIADFSNIVIVLLRLLFYLSGIFYSASDKLGSFMNIYKFVCPTGYIIEQARNVMMYGLPVSYKMLAYWLIAGVVFCIIGLFLTYKNENTYMKVV